MTQWWSDLLKFCNCKDRTRRVCPSICLSIHLSIHISVRILFWDSGIRIWEACIWVSGAKIWVSEARNVSQRLRFGSSSFNLSLSGRIWDRMGQTERFSNLHVFYRTLSPSESRPKNEGRWVVKLCAWGGITNQELDLSIDRKQIHYFPKH